MIEMKHVYRTYDGPVHALSNVTFSIGKGEFVFLIGPSGAGKSTLFNIISASDRVSSGQVIVGDRNINKMRSSEVPFFRRSLGIVFQDFRLVSHFPVVENVALPLLIAGETEARALRSARNVLESVDMHNRLYHFPNQLSGGERQRVAIARALVHKPKVIIADEPTGNLDPNMSQEILQLFKRANAHGTTVFYATHDHSLFREGVDRVISMNGGQVLAA